MNDFLELITQWLDDSEKFIERSIGGLRRALFGAEKELLSQILTELVPKLEYRNEVLIANDRNMARLQILDRVMDRFAGSTGRELTERFASELMEVAGRAPEYYILAGFDQDKVNRVAEDTALMRRTIGIDERGGILKGGYLDRLAAAAEAKETVLNYIVSSMASRRGPSEFVEGLRGLIQGVDGDNGVLRSHWERYAFDSYSQVREIQNLHMANELRLNYFVYTGGVIDSTRRFCAKRNRKVFHRDETEDWKNDPDLIDQKTKQSYNPLIERGRMNCRHFLAWISDKRAKELRPDLN